MNKKAYMKPQMRAIEFKYRHFLCGSEPQTVRRVSSNNVFDDIQSDEGYNGNIR